MFATVLSQIKHYWTFYRSATTIYQAHSPLLYAFAKDVVEARPTDTALQTVEAHRRTLLADPTKVDFVELGAGSRSSHTTKTIAQIAKTSLSRSRQCQQIYSIVKAYQPKTVVEMGTSLGIATAYMAAARTTAHIHTLEGDPTVAAYARKLFADLDFTGIRIHEGDFAETLPEVLDQLSTVDLAFVDGNHSYEPTMAYFHELVAKSNKETILIFDDIYWSTDMMRAWSDIQADKAVRCTVDLFHMGVVWLHPREQPVIHQMMVPFRQKPWRIGLFG